MALPIYKIKSLEHTYGDQPVLSIVDLEIREGSIVGLIGPNGSGKSTLLRLLGLIERPTAGQIFYQGSPVEPFSRQARFQITLLPQEPFLMKRSVFKNVSYGLKLRGGQDDQVPLIMEALSLVGLSYEDFARRPWYALSGGEAQRVALAARLALKPKVLLLDEPTASVDASSAQLIREASLRAREQWGTTLVVASHDWQWLYEVCDDVRSLFRGIFLGPGNDNIVLGPWQDFGNRGWGKRLSDNQEIRTPSPPNKDAAAIFEVRLMNEETPGKGDVVLHGTISRLTLEKNRARVHVAIIVGNLTLTMRLSPDQVRTQGLFPGMDISVHYRLDDVKWL